MNPKEKMEECSHWTLMPPFPANLNRDITPK